MWSNCNHGHSPKEGQHIIEPGGIVSKTRRLYDEHKLTFGEESIQGFSIAVESLQVLGFVFLAEIAGLRDVVSRWFCCPATDLVSRLIILNIWC